jgi:CHAD domain-containing protein
MLPGVESGEVGAIHRARVASRRLRELLPVLELDHDKARKLGRRLKKLTRSLGAIRELDVVLLLLDELRASRRLPDAPLRRVTDSVRQERDDARARVHPKDVAADFKRVTKKLQRVAEELQEVDRRSSGRRGWRWAIEARVARRSATLKHAIREAGSMYVPERVHQVRLALKKLRYGVELSGEAAGLKMTSDLRALERWQELLGRMRDRQMLMERVRRIQASMEPPNLAVWRDLDALVMALENNCRRMHARFVRDRGAIVAVCDRLGARASKRELGHLVTGSSGR